jgi:hypothetical protein
MIRSILVHIFLLPLALSFAAGCTPRVRVIANPRPHDNGIRYYRPKPYLKVVPAEVAAGKDATRVDVQLVTISLEYLPDFSEEYAIDVRPGFGVANVSLTLEDGWNLTEINQELDSQTDETIDAAANLLRAASGFVTTADGKQAPQSSFDVHASNVPLGYYESVIGCGPDGRKRLFGFRYLGFLPYESCPTILAGGQKACCNDPSMPLYGLTFADGRMVFKPLDTIRNPTNNSPNTDVDYDEPSAEDSGNSVSTSSLPVSAGNTVPPLTFRLDVPKERDAFAANLESELLRSLRTQFPDTQRVQAVWVAIPETAALGSSLRLQVTVASSSLLDQARLHATTHGYVAEIAQGRFLYTIELQ